MVARVRKKKRAWFYALGLMGCLALAAAALSEMLFRKDDLWVYPRGRVTLVGSRMGRQKYVFWNPHSFPVKLVTMPSCSCTTAEFPQVVGPYSFASGTVDIDFSSQPPGRQRKDFEIALSGSSRGVLLYIPITIDHTLEKT